MLGSKNVQILLRRLVQQNPNRNLDNSNFHLKSQALYTLGFSPSESIQNIWKFQWHKSEITITSKKSEWNQRSRINTTYCVLGLKVRDDKWDNSNPEAYQLGFGAGAGYIIMSIKYTALL